MRQSSGDPLSAGFEHKNHFADLDGLRGLLALSVVYLHYGGNQLLLHVTHGRVHGFMFQLSVDFFFLLSGFVLTFAMRDGLADAAGFAIKRAFRLLPLHYIGAAAMVVLALLATRPEPLLQLFVTPGKILSDLAAVTPALRHDPLDGPAWSVTWELFLPVIAVLLAQWVKLPVRRLAPALLVLLLAGLSYTSWRVALDPRVLGGPRAFLGLAGGMCLYHVFARRPLPAALHRPAPFYVLIVLLLAIMAAARVVPLAAMPLPWVAALTIAAGAGTHSLLASRPFRWLGSISYSLYLIHVPVLVAMFVCIGGDRGNPLIRPIALVTTLVVATLLTRWVERPAMRVGRRLAARRSPTAPA